MNTNTLGWIPAYLSTLSHQIKGDREIAGTSLRWSPSGKKKSSEICTSIQSFGPANFCMWCKDVGGRFEKISLKDFGKGMKIHMMKYVRCTSSYTLKKDKTMRSFISQEWHLQVIIITPFMEFDVASIWWYALLFVKKI